MVVTKALPVRWVRNYKIFFVLGLLTIIFQIYLAIQFISLNNDAQNYVKWNPQKDKFDSETSVNSEKKIKDGLIDDEDSPNFLNLQIKKEPNENANHKINNKTTLRLQLEELDFVPLCEINIKESISAIHRAKTQHCKQLISNTTCLEKQKMLYPISLPHYCPTNGLTKNKALGCFKDEKKSRLLDDFYVKYENENTPGHCIQICLQSGFPYAGVQFSKECFCGTEAPPSTAKLADSSCNMKCSGNSQKVCGGYFTINVYETGIARPVSQEVVTDIPKDIRKIKIALLLTLNGRALRQVQRLIKMLAHKNVFFYIHIDVRQDYLFRELLSLEKQFPNVVKLTRNRFSTIWGGASLLTMLLSCMKELLESDWSWDFVINLSESDYPVKTIDKLIDFLSANVQNNFVKSHGREAQRFIQKQGLDKTFVECDNRMWRVCDRKLPEGVIMDGGSDWVALSRQFVTYVANESPSDLVSGLLKVFRHTLLPAESFFHTVLKNSEFCNTIVDNNLHVTNWKRKLGCKCQYKHIVDWCGCSPNDFKPEDWSRIQNTEKKQIFFARKFEPIVNQAVILQLERWLLGTAFVEASNLNSYWQSIYHHQDMNPVDDVLLTISHSIVRIRSKRFPNKNCQFRSSKIIEVSTFHADDFYKSNLVHFETNEERLRYEISFKPKSLMFVRKLTNLSKRLQSIYVSSDYDLKERMSRNFGRMLGVNSEPVLIFSFEADMDFGVKTSNVSFVWINPAGDIEEINHIQLDENFTIDTVKPQLRQPLLPGLWTLNMVHKREILVQVKFLIIPLQFVSGNPIGQNQIKMYHFGNNDRKSFEPEWDVFGVKSSEKENLKRIAVANSKRFGEDLENWIDSLVNKAYKIGELCVVKRTNDSCFEGLPMCKETDWSSLAPDPKSSIKSYDVKTGKFIS